MSTQPSKDTRGELRKRISKEMGYWKYETDDYDAYDGSPKKTTRVQNLINQEVRTALDAIEKSTHNGSNVFEIGASIDSTIAAQRAKYE